MASLPDHHIERWAYRIWVALVGAVTLALIVIGTAATVRHAMLKGPLLSRSQSQFVIELASYPSRAKAAVWEVAGRMFGKSYALTVKRADVETPAWKRIFPAPADSGYLLLSGMDPDVQQATVRLIRIADGKLMARWVPGWAEIVSRSAKSHYSEGITLQSVGAMHPLLLDDGDIIFNTTGAMVRIGLCSAKPIWLLAEVLHHSNQRDADGNIWTPSVSSGGFPNNKFLDENIRDDAIARISPNGRLLERRSFAKIMRENGLEALLLGTQGFELNNDPIHLNEIAVAPSTTPYWRRGDLLISARHLSTLFLYRPTTGRIIWHKTGPWMNQHSAAFVDDHRISVLNNNIVASAPASAAFVEPEDTNQVMVYDFKTGTLTRPFKKLVDAARPVTVTEGRARLLPDGGLFFEETNTGRLLRFTRDRLLWSYVNNVDDQTIGTLAWSRYLSADDAAPALRAIAAKQCAPAR